MSFNPNKYLKKRGISSGFNPDEYLKNRPSAGFDPNKYLQDRGLEEEEESTIDKISGAAAKFVGGFRTKSTMTEFTKGAIKHSKVTPPKDIHEPKGREPALVAGLQQAGLGRHDPKSGLLLAPLQAGSKAQRAPEEPETAFERAERETAQQTLETTRKVLNVGKTAVKAVGARLISQTEALSPKFEDKVTDDYKQRFWANFSKEVGQEMIQTGTDFIAFFASPEALMLHGLGSVFGPAAKKGFRSWMVNMAKNYPKTHKTFTTDILQQVGERMATTKEFTKFDPKRVRDIIRRGQASTPLTAEEQAFFMQVRDAGKDAFYDVMRKGAFKQTVPRKSYEFIRKGVKKFGIELPTYTDARAFAPPATKFGGPLRLPAKAGPTTPPVQAQAIKTPSVMPAAEKAKGAIIQVTKPIVSLQKAKTLIDKPLPFDIAGLEKEAKIISGINLPVDQIPHDIAARARRIKSSMIQEYQNEQGRIDAVVSQAEVLKEYRDAIKDAGGISQYKSFKKVEGTKQKRSPLSDEIRDIDKSWRGRSPLDEVAIKVNQTHPHLFPEPTEKAVMDAAEKYKLLKRDQVAPGAPRKTTLTDQDFDKLDSIVAKPTKGSGDITVGTNDLDSNPVLHRYVQKNPELHEPVQIEKAIDTQHDLAHIPHEGLQSEKYINPEALKNVQAVDSVFDELSSETGSVNTGLVTKALSGIKGLYTQMHDWTFMFGEAERLDHPLYDQLSSAYGKKNASIDKAIDTMRKLKGVEFDNKIALELTFTINDKTLAPRPEIKEFFDGALKVFEEIEKKSLENKHMKMTFQDRMTSENNLEIDKLKKAGQTVEVRAKIKALQNENDKLAIMRYLPQNIVAQRAMENKLRTLRGDDRKVFLERASKISAQYTKRTGKKFLREYYESGLLDSKDLDIRKLLVDTVNSYYEKQSLLDLFSYARQRELIKPFDKKLYLEGWESPDDLGIISPELKGQLLHPVFGRGLQEMVDMKKGMQKSAIGKSMSAIKQGQFMKFFMIQFYNINQKVFRGMWSFDPRKEALATSKAFRGVVGRNADWHEMNSKLLFQPPYDLPRAAKDEATTIALRQTQAKLPGLVKWFEKITDTSWAKGDVGVMDVVLAAHKVVGKFTWTCDQIQRMQSVYVLEAMKWPRDEAIRYAARAHGAYSELSLEFKKTMSKMFFVHSFRVLMPIEMAKVLVEPVTAMIQYKLKGKKVPRYKVETMAKSLIGTAIMPIAIDQYMKARGFETDKFLWKYKKKVFDPKTGREKEVVAGVNYILNMPMKYWHRLTATNPIRNNMLTHPAVNFLRWEVHPVYRMIFDIGMNRPSFGSLAGTVYDPDAKGLTRIPKQMAQSAAYFFGNSFKFWGFIIEAIEAGTMTYKEKEAQKRIMKQSLTLFDRTVIGIYGYTYIRSHKKERKLIMTKQLEKVWMTKLLKYQKAYSGETLKRKRQGLKEWKDMCKDWIAEEMR